MVKHDCKAKDPCVSRVRLDASLSGIHYKIHVVHVHGLAADRGPGVTLELQIEEVKKSRFHLSTRKVRRRDGEPQANQATLHLKSKVHLAGEPYEDPRSLDKLCMLRRTEVERAKHRVRITRRQFEG